MYVTYYMAWVVPFRSCTSTLSLCKLRETSLEYTHTYSHPCCGNTKHKINGYVFIAVYTHMVHSGTVVTTMRP